MRRLTPLRGTWLAVAIMSPVLIAQIALALPDFFVDDVPDESITTPYDATGDAVTLTSATSESVDAPAGKAEGPGDTAELPGGATNVPSDTAQVPDGPINHGQVMKQVQELTDGSKSGCLTSAVARSDLGKGDQRDRTGETTTTVAPNFADEFDCPEVDVADDHGSSEVSEGPAAKEPESQKKSDKGQEKKSDKGQEKKSDKGQEKKSDK